MSVAVPDRCPLCSGDRGDGTVVVQTRTYHDTTLRGQRYLVRTLEVPGICAGCSRGLLLKRWAAGVLAVGSAVAVGLFGALIEAKPLVFGAGVYGLYLFRTLEYTWADWLLYGSDFETRLAAYRPEGDELSYPGSLWHFFGRIAAIPVLIVSLAVFGGLLGVLARGPRPKPSPTASAPHDPVRSVFLEPWSFVYPYVAPNQRLLRGTTLVAYVQEASVPSQYPARARVMSRRLLETFLAEPQATHLELADVRPPPRITKPKARELLAELDAREKAKRNALQRADP